MAGPIFKPEVDFPEVYKLCQMFVPSENDLVKVRDTMNREMTAGLSKEGHDRSSVPCYLSYVQDLPSGRERGRFLALEMMPTNCRIMLVRFSSEKDVYMSSKCVIIPHSIAAAKGTELFNFLASNIATFVKDKKVEKENLPMGIAFAFSLNKLALDVGILIAWTKEFGATGAIGKDVVQLLRDALAKFPEIMVNILGIINVAIGSLLALCWTQPDTRIGLNMGNITNSCYVEEVDNCHMYTGTNNKSIMIVNTDWAHFGDGGQLDFIRNEFDKTLDESSTNPGHRIYEKFSGALFISELVRMVIVRLMRNGTIFEGQTLDLISNQWRMDMSSVFDLDSDPPGVYTKAQEVMEKYRIRHCKERDLAAVRYISNIILSRAAMMLSSGVACLINRMKIAQISISVDGGIYRLNQTFQTVINKYTLQLTDPRYKFEYVVNQDSCGVGAAIMAGLAHADKYRGESKIFELDF
ncbi:hexokinase type 1 [Drosophila pseudoobscura]|uniref:Phosphotransferase n=1 Tax=Drosophila pseudoobscura pseudoobscura TaxID=46245 RepID=A0A6I8UQ62_DROPS|nr:hexokinase type 1 [Drosophila pseudoobscura]